MDSKAMEDWKKNWEMPHDFNYEHALLGTWMADEKGEFYFAAPLPSKEFFSREHEHIAQAIEALAKKGAIISVATVTSWMKDAHFLDDNIQDKPMSMYLEELPEYAQAMDVAVYYRDCLHDLDAKRKIMIQGRKLFEEGPQMSLATMTEETSQLLFYTEPDDGITVAQGLEQMMLKEKPKRRLVRSNLHGLDGLIYGFQPSSMYTVIARMSVGKTSLLSWIALQAGGAGIPFAYVTAEMAPELLIQRMLSTLSGVDLSVVMRYVATKEMDDENLEKFIPASQRLYNMPIHFISVRSGQIDDVARSLRKYKIVHHIEIAGMDYLQLFHDGHTESQAQELDNVSHKTKAICNELDIPLIAVVAANRSNVKEGRSVDVSDVRGSDSIGYDTDVMISLNEMEQDIGQPEDTKRIKLRVVKNRNGRIGEAIVTFDGKTQRWSDA